MGAGQLSTPIKVERRAPDAGDKFGKGNSGAYVVLEGLNEIWARNVPKQGGEVSLAGRLEGRQAYELLVRRDPVTEQISAKDRITTLERSPKIINVRSAAPYQADPSYILITGEAGTANG